MSAVELARRTLALWPEQKMLEKEDDFSRAAMELVNESDSYREKDARIMAMYLFGQASACMAMSNALVGNGTLAIEQAANAAVLLERSRFVHAVERDAALRAESDMDDQFWQDQVEAEKRRMYFLCNQSEVAK